MSLPQAQNSYNVQIFFINRNNWWKNFCTLERQPTRFCRYRILFVPVKHVTSRDVEANAFSFIFAETADKTKCWQIGISSLISWHSSLESRLGSASMESGLSSPSWFRFDSLSQTCCQKILSLWPPFNF
jgi:hypothetical protein